MLVLPASITHYAIYDTCILYQIMRRLHSNILDINQLMDMPYSSNV